MACSTHVVPCFLIELASGEVGRASSSSADSLIFSIACGVNFTRRLPLTDGLAFVIVMAAPFGSRVVWSFMSYALYRTPDVMAVTKWRMPDVMAITKWSISGFGAAMQTACQQRGDDSSAKCTNIFAS